MTEASCTRAARPSRPASRHKPARPFACRILVLYYSMYCMHPTRALIHEIQ